MPAGADAVVMVEETERASEDAVQILWPCIRARTSDGRGPTSRADRRCCARASC